MRVFRIVFIVAVSFVLAGCLGRSTPKDVLTYQPSPVLRQAEGKLIAYIPFDTRCADTTIASYGGIVKMRQPISLLIPSEKEREIKAGLPVIAVAAMVDELRLMGFTMQEWNTSVPAGTPVLSGELCDVRMDIYDPGLKGIGSSKFMEGYGSAGDYTEGFVTLKNVRMKLNDEWKVLMPEERFSAKMAQALFRMDVNVVTIYYYVGVSTLKSMASGTLSLEMPDAIFDRKSMSPVELASRLAARKLAEQILTTAITSGVHLPQTGVQAQ